MTKTSQRGIILGIVMAILLSPIPGSASNPASTETNENTIMGDADWAADVNGDGTTDLRGQLHYTLERGLIGRRILLTGTWEIDDGNSSGTVTVYHLVLSKFYGVYRGVCAGSIVWDDITLRFVGHFTNDWEIGRWTLRSLMIIHAQVAHMPFN